MSSFPNLFSLFGGPTNAARDALRYSGAQAGQEVSRNLGAASARGANPAALASAMNQAQQSQRVAMADSRARALAGAGLQEQQDMSQMFGGALEGLTSIGAMAAPFLSDEEAKEDIREASRAIDQFLGSIDPATFTYSQGPAQGQRRAGVMAQDLERSEVGRTMVTEDPASGMRAVDPQAAMSALLAAQARLHDRLARVEEGNAGSPPGDSRSEAPLPIEQEWMDFMLQQAAAARAEGDEAGARDLGEQAAGPVPSWWTPDGSSRQAPGVPPPAPPVARAPAVPARPPVDTGSLGTGTSDTRRLNLPPGARLRPTDDPNMFVLEEESTLDRVLRSGRNLLGL